MSNNKSFDVLLIDSDRDSKSEYQDIFKGIANCQVFIVDNFLPNEDLIKQKKVDAILVNIKNLPEDLEKDLNSIKKQFINFGIPTILYRKSLNFEVIAESILNTSFIVPERILLTKLITDFKEYLLHDGGDIEHFIHSQPNKDPESLESPVGYFESSELNQQKAVFIRNIIYEIRTLLNNVGAPIQLIKEKIDDPELIPFFSIIDTTLSRMVEFTFKATLSSDLKLGNYPIKKTEINLEEIARFSMLELSEFLELERVKLTVNASSSKPLFYGDKDLLFHGFNAILDKTINLTKENGEIVIAFDVFKDRINCRITSNSITFPKEDILEIFNSSAIEQEIGLALAKIVLTIHNASYWVDLTQAKGVTIGITFNISEHE